MDSVFDLRPFLSNVYCKECEISSRGKSPYWWIETLLRSFLRYITLYIDKTTLGSGNGQGDGMSGWS